MKEWTDFFVAEVGASAALAGLLFVGVSLNLNRILVLPGLPNRAFHGLSLLLAMLVVASLMLMPGQPDAARAIELLVVGLAMSVGGLMIDLPGIGTAEPAYRFLFLQNMTLSQCASLPYVVGGAVMLAGGSGGFYWVAAAMLLSVVKAVTDAWVLLVEINR